MSGSRTGIGEDAEEGARPVIEVPAEVPAGPLLILLEPFAGQLLPGYRVIVGTPLEYPVITAVEYKPPYGEPQPP